MGPEDVERRDYAALVDSLAGTLDLRGGLREAVDVVNYTAMSSHIAGFLDLEAGLQSALAVSSRDDAELPLRASAEKAPDSVADLLLRIGNGDVAAWDEIFARYGKLVSTTVRSFRLQEADALDAVQMTWLRLSENAHRVQFPERLGGWLATTARRECLRILRQTKPAQLVIGDFIGLAPGTVVDHLTDSEYRVIDADITRTLRKLVAELSPRRQTLVWMLLTDNPLSYAEVARAAGIPPGGIGPTRARALRQLRAELHEYVLGSASGAKDVEGNQQKMVGRAGEILNDLLDKWSKD
jgi:RNA polymerase sigma factor (sigma-70 family)